MAPKKSASTKPSKGQSRHWGDIGIPPPTHKVKPKVKTKLPTRRNKKLSKTPSGLKQIKSNIPSHSLYNYFTTIKNSTKVPAKQTQRPPPEPTSNPRPPPEPPPTMNQTAELPIPPKIVKTHFHYTAEAPLPNQNYLAHDIRPPPEPPPSEHQEAEPPALTEIRAATYFQWTADGLAFDQEDSDDEPEADEPDKET